MPSPSRTSSNDASFLELSVYEVAIMAITTLRITNTATETKEMNRNGPVNKTRPRRDNKETGGSSKSETTRV